MSILKSKDGDIFGAFTELEWNSSGEWITNFGGHFVFKVLPDGNVLRINEKPNHYNGEIYCHKDHLCSFHAFFCKFTNNQDCSYFLDMKYYQLPDSFQGGNSAQDKTTLYDGKAKFIIDDIEVFKVY